MIVLIYNIIVPYIYMYMFVYIFITNERAIQSVLFADRMIHTVLMAVHRFEVVDIYDETYPFDNMV